MSSNKTSFHIGAYLKSIAWARVGYPLGVLAVFCVIIVSALLSYRFFTAMIGRATILFMRSEAGSVAFPLREYKTVAPFFRLLPDMASSTIDKHVPVRIVASGASSDRMDLVSALLRGDGWTEATVSAEDAAATAVTLVQSKASFEPALHALTALLVKNGFVVAEGKALDTKESSALLLRVGIY